MSQQQPEHEQQLEKLEQRILTLLWVSIVLGASAIGIVVLWSHESAWVLLAANWACLWSLRMVCCQKRVVKEAARPRVELVDFHSA